ncbi:unnamed protein product [Pedinophyceae sp. YPF-701]|nr:unnamed protein product [Pedinophyceae sp. YPF-701]
MAQPNDGAGLKRKLAAITATTDVEAECREHEQGGQASPAAKRPAGGKPQQAPVPAVALQRSRPALVARDIQRLLLHMAKIEPAPSNKFYVRAADALQQVVVLTAPGVSQAMNDVVPPLMQATQRLLGEPCACMMNKTPCGVDHFFALNALHNVPAAAVPHAPGVSTKDKGPATALELCLTRKEMEEHGYPLPDDSGCCPDGYLATRPRSDASARALVAIDCEMVLTAGGHTLARYTLVGEDGGVIVDEIVKPAAAVTDHLTQYSGITAQMLSKATTTLEQARERILKEVARETVLVGHSLENDLRATRIVHERVLDTSVAYPHPDAAKKFALRRLAWHHLKKAIQKGRKGHDSVEDASTAMQLAQLKMKNGRTYGTAAWRDKLSLSALLEGAGRRVAIVDRSENVSRVIRAHELRAETRVVQSDGEMVKELVHVVRKQGGAGPAFEVVFGQLMGLAKVHAQCAEVCVAAETGEVGVLADEDAALVAAAARKTDARVAEVHAALPAGSLLVVWSPFGDTSIVRQLDRLKRRIEEGQEGLPARWQHEALLQEASDRAKAGLLWLGIKR